MSVQITASSYYTQVSTEAQAVAVTVSQWHRAAASVAVPPGLGSAACLLLPAPATGTALADRSAVPGRGGELARARARN